MYTITTAQTNTVENIRSGTGLTGIMHEAIKEGELTRPDTCSKCGKSRDIVAHYIDYSRPLDVVWLCISCDRQLHADLKRKEKGGH